MEIHECYQLNITDWICINLTSQEIICIVVCLILLILIMYLTILYLNISS
jgi:hypothetical protein